MSTTTTEKMRRTRRSTTQGDESRRITKRGRQEATHSVTDMSDYYNKEHQHISHGPMSTTTTKKMRRTRRSTTRGDVSRRITKRGRQQATLRLIPQRELIVRTPITTSVSTSTPASTIANTMACSKCGTFLKSGRASCCAPGGAWYQNCGGVGNRNAEHRWSEGVEACKRKFNVDGM